MVVESTPVLDVSHGGGGGGCKMMVGRFGYGEREFAIAEV